MTWTTALITLLLAGLAGGLVPVAGRWSERGLHLFASIAGGVFLGTIFLHLLPEMAASGREGDAGDPWPWLLLAAGFGLLFVLERVWLGRRHGDLHGGCHDRHHVVWTASFVGLSLHAGVFGLGLAAFVEGERATLTWVLGIALVVHKAGESFSLGTLMRLAEVGRARSLQLLALFALITPATMLAGERLGTHGGRAPVLLMGFACGTFLYVTLLDVLPEVFHGAGRRRHQVLGLVVGVALTVAGGEPEGGAGRFVARVVREAWHLFAEMAPFLLFGFLVAGVLAQVLAPERFRGWFAGRGLRPVAAASVVGAPLPLCSCSVVPVGVSLRRAGASRGATSSFLIATPETGVDSIAASWALLDPFLTVARPLGAIVSAIVTGVVVDLRDSGARDEEPSPAEPAATDSCGDTCAPGCDAAPESAAVPRGGLVRRSLRYACVDLMDDLALPLVLGVLASGLIGEAVPASVFEHPLAQGAGGLFLMLVFGLPIYVCAAASTPIAAALILKGLSPGAALVFLLAGPATNFGSLAVLVRALGRRAVVTHVVVLALVTLALGWAVDRLYPALGLEPFARAGEEHGLLPAWLTLAAAVAFAGLLLLSFLRTSRAQAE